jgi:hypothetical protein
MEPSPHVSELISFCGILAIYQHKPDFDNYNDSINKFNIVSTVFFDCDPFESYK